MPSSKQILNLSSSIERLDETTYKQLCRQCGGKGFYLHQNFDIESATITQSEIVNCDQCESGFVYGKR